MRSHEDNEHAGFLEALSHCFIHFNSKASCIDNVVKEYTTLSQEATKLHGHPNDNRFQ